MKIIPCLFFVLSSLVIEGASVVSSSGPWTASGPIVFGSVPAPWTPEDFVTVWNVTAGDTIVLPTPSGTGITYEYDVKWGDGTNEYAVTDYNKSHTYVATGLYTNIITGKLNKWYFNNAGLSAARFYQIVQFGNTQLKEMRCGWYGCTNMVGPIPSFSIATNVTALDSTFRNCSNIVSAMPVFTNLYGLTTVASLAENCYKLTGPLPAMDGLTNLTSINSIYSRCLAVTGILPSFSTLTNLQDCGFAFAFLRGVTGSPPALTNNYKITALTYWLQECGSLTGPVPALNHLTNITTTAFAFLQCTNLTGSFPTMAGMWKLASIRGTYYGAGCLANTSKVDFIFGANNYTNLTDARECFRAYTGLQTNLLGNAYDFTNKTFIATFYVGPASTNSSYRMFYNQTNLTDYATIDPNWK